MAAKFTNRDRLRQKLKAYPPAIQAQIKPALQSSAEQIVAMQRSLAPVESGAKPRRTPGTLKDSIGWAWGDVARTISGALGVSAGAGSGSPLKISIFAGSVAAFYARFVEFGTHAGKKGGRIRSLAGNRIRDRKVYRNHPGSRARPFFFPPVRALMADTTKKIQAAVRAATRSISS